MNSKKARARQLIIVFALIAFPLRISFAALAQDAPATPQAEVPVEVVDVAAPIVWVPMNMQVAAVDASGSVVTFDEPNAYDEIDGGVAVSCDGFSGSLFPLGLSTITCTASDSSGNSASVAFTILVSDLTPPVIKAPAEIVIDAAGPDGSVVNFGEITATDNVDGALPVFCDPSSEFLLPIGTTTVSCTTQDAVGNVTTITFPVTVNPLEEVDPTEDPELTPEVTETPVNGTVTPEDPNATPTETATQDPALTVTPVPTDVTWVPPTATPTPVVTTGPARVTPVETTIPSAIGAGVDATAVASTTPIAKATASPTPARDALSLPWPPPDSFVIVTDGGPIDGLAAIWGNLDFPISQEFGHTEFSIAHSSWYAYGAGFGLDGFEHTGLDIGMPAGTPLYSPVDGTVMVSGGVPFYTFYGNGQPGVGELMIQTDDGQQVILGHMGLITVGQGERVRSGQFVGLSGGENGDHLHLEVRELQIFGYYKIVDPRVSFLVGVIGTPEKPQKWSIPIMGDLRYRMPDYEPRLALLR